MPTSISEDGPQLSAEGNFHQHINVFLVLERLVQPECDDDYDAIMVTMMMVTIMMVVMMVIMMRDISISI